MPGRLAERCRDAWNYGFDLRQVPRVIADMSSVILNPLFLPLFAAHYRNVTAQIADALRSGRPPAQR